ncbi:MAG: Dna2/Cas4 domain-containing protein [Candidatus Aenigmatarchaeota archaeon]
MKLKIEVDKKTLEKSVEIIDFIGKKTIDNLLFEFLNNKIYITDILFLALDKLNRDEKIVSKANEIEKNDFLDENYKGELIKYLERKISELGNKPFFTSLEVSKFYQCQRRFFLEKVVHSRQKKSEKSYKGEVFHKSISNFITNYNKYVDNIEVLASMVTENVIKEYEKKVKIDKSEVLKYLYQIDSFIRKQNFKYIISEPILISIKYGIIGTPDIIGITRDNEIIPFEIKTKTNKIKEGLKIQIVGEAFVTEVCFRKEVNKSFLLSLQNEKTFEINITEEDKKQIQNILNMMKKVLLSMRIPPMSNLPNFRKTVCPYCHVKETCDFIEETRKSLLKKKV